MNDDPMINVIAAELRVSIPNRDDHDAIATKIATKIASALRRSLSIDQLPTTVTCPHTPGVDCKRERCGFWSAVTNTCGVAAVGELVWKLGASPVGGLFVEVVNR